MTMKFSNFTLHQRVYTSSAHNIQHTNNNKWKYNVELFDEGSLMARNDCEVAPEH